jgi:hypothetical protein
LNDELDSISIDFSLDAYYGGFAPYREINLPKRLAYCADLTTCDGGAHIDLFIHEFAHAWININTPNYLGISGSIRGFISNGAEAAPVGGYLPYSEFINTPTPAGLNTEQMADWFMWFDKDRRKSWSD